MKIHFAQNFRCFLVSRNKNPCDPFLTIFDITLMNNVEFFHVWTFVRLLLLEQQIDQTLLIRPYVGPVGLIVNLNLSCPPCLPAGKLLTLLPKSGTLLLRLHSKTN